ncbi:MAG: DUF2752 domain-containing protein [Puniceicoccales bacterium]|jgi:hypothetical protein|nr:DUF2752 domain-containing protein [Puniceicoccales bacterium]
MPFYRRPLIPGEISAERWLSVLIPVGWLTGGITVLQFQEWLPWCILFRVTGIPCPACGGTRSTLALAHGHIGQAFYFNPAWTLLCLGSIAVWLWCAGTAWRRTPVLRYHANSKLGAWLPRAGVIAAVVLNWLWNCWREMAS